MHSPLVDDKETLAFAFFVVYQTSSDTCRIGISTFFLFLTDAADQSS
jgi:hypothetical protein